MAMTTPERILMMFIMLLLTIIIYLGTFKKQYALAWKVAAVSALIEICAFGAILLIGG